MWNPHRVLARLLDVYYSIGHARCRRSFWRPSWPAAATPTRRSTPCPPRAGPRNTVTPPIAATRATSGATSMTLRWTRSVKGSLASAPALSSRNWIALNAQTPGGCSLMEWENDENGRRRWCTRLFQGGGISGPLFDGFDNLYVGQPGAIRVLFHHPVDPLAPTGNRNAFHPKVSRTQSTARASRTLGRCRFSTRTAAPWSAIPWIWWTASAQRIHPRALRLRTGPGRLPGRRGAGIRGGERDGGRGPVAAGCPCGRADRVEVSPRSEPAAHPGIDQRRGQRRVLARPVLSKRRLHDLRQRTRRAVVGAARRRRQAEMVGAAVRSSRRRRRR